MRVSWLLTASCLLAALLRACQNPGDSNPPPAENPVGTPVAVTGVTLDLTATVVYVGWSKILTATVSPADATDKSVSWSTSNDAYATVVSTGALTARVTAVAAGAATITVTTSEGGKTAACNVTTMTAAVTGVTLNALAKSLSVGDTFQLVPSFTPYYATDQAVTWSTDNSSVADVSATGLITAKAAGTATVTVTTHDGGFTKPCAVTVTNVAVTGLSLFPTTAVLIVGGTRQLTPTVTPSNATNKTVSWSSSNGSVADVSSSGLVTGYARGSATITATTAEGGFSKTCAVTVDRTVSLVAGTGVMGGGWTGDGNATSVQLCHPWGIALSASGDILIADTFNNRIRKVSGTTITTVAGNDSYGYVNDGVAATSTPLYQPAGVAVDSSDNIYIADTKNHRVRKVDHLTGTITTIAGTGTAGFSGDNDAATAAKLNNPYGVAVSSAGDVYIADQYNARVRMVDHATGYISTVAGNGPGSFYGENVPATSATIAPAGIALDSSGNLYIADTSNRRIRRVDHATGYITTVAGTGTDGYSGDNGPATSAQITIPFSVAVDGSGNIYFDDAEWADKSRVRMVDTSGTITTVAGTGTLGHSGDGGAATAADVAPIAVAADSQAVYWAETNWNCVRKAQ